MSTSFTPDDAIKLDYAPPIPGLRFRRYRGESDFPAMLEVSNASYRADGDEFVETIESMTSDFRHLTNCNLDTDLLLVEVDGKLVGYQRVTWLDDAASGDWVYLLFMRFLIAEWRGKGLDEAMLRWAEDRARANSLEQASTARPVAEEGAAHDQPERHAMLRERGYHVDTYMANMLRPDLDNIPDTPLPPGIEVRPVTPDHYRAIFEADRQGFSESWGFSESDYGESAYENWINDKIVFMPHLWQIAWDVEKNTIAGQVRSFINRAENETYHRKRGYTEFISVLKPYRRQGLAKALLARSLQILKEHGMQQAQLGVHTENLNRALDLYESMGFREFKRFTIYRKPLA